MHLPGEIDGRVLALSAGVCLFTTVLMALVPALQTGKIDLASTLKMESAGVVGGRGRAWVQSGLVLVQVSLSFILLVGAALLLQSLLNVRTSCPGFTTRGGQLIRTYFRTTCLEEEKRECYWQRQGLRTSTAS